MAPQSVRKARASHQLALREQPRLSFSGHQTFPFRYSWLPKGVLAVKSDPQIFFREDALVTLGVGKNMVDSIRYWCEALGLVRVDGRTRQTSLEPLGAFLFGRNRREKGVDPYLEDPATLWLLHWQLASRPDLASTWYLAFTRWNRSVFTRDQLAKWILGIARQSTATKSSPSSIKRDVDVFLRTYIPVQEDRRRPLEDSFDCPLGELGLLRQLEDGFYQFHQGPKASLPGAVLAYALITFWNDAAPQQETLNVERLLYDPGSPGAAFKLTDKVLVAMLEQLPADSGMRYDETAGLRALLRTNKKRFQDPARLLENHYRAH